MINQILTICWIRKIAKKKDTKTSFVQFTLFKNWKNYSIIKISTYTFLSIAEDNKDQN